MTIPISVCLTTWNRARVLPLTIESILSQTFRAFELIITDNHSDDDTEKVCLAYAKKDARIRYFRNPTNLGMPGNLNVAISHVRGKYIANLHDGDIYRSDLLYKWKQALDDTPTALFVFNDYVLTKPNGVRRHYRMPFPLRVAGYEIALHYFRTLTSCVWGTTMVRASAYEKYGRFDPAFGFIADVDMWLRLSLHGDVAYIAEPLIVLGIRAAGEVHPFRRGFWQGILWGMIIYVRHLLAYRSAYPMLVAPYMTQYLKLFRQCVLLALLHCLRGNRWERLKEGLAICRDSDDAALRRLGWVLASESWKPDWYGKELWDAMRLDTKKVPL